MHIFLDDERKPSDVTWIDLPLLDWTIVRSFEEFAKIIYSNGMPKFVSFDNDLHPSHYEEFFRAKSLGVPFEYHKMNPLTGYHCAMWLKNYAKHKNLAIPPFIVHSRNTFAQVDIKNLLTNSKNLHTV